MGNLSSGCGCGNNHMCNDNDCCYSIIWIIILLSICGNGRGNGLFGGRCGCDDDGCGNNSCIWLILLLLFCGNGFGGMGCGCGCGNNWNNGCNSCGDNCGC